MKPVVWAAVDAVENAEVGRRPDREKRRGRLLRSVLSYIETKKLRRKLKHRFLDGRPDGFDDE